MTTSLCCAYLRVYQPLDAFAETERRWIEAGCIDKRQSSVLPTPSLIAAEERKELFSREVDGTLYVCPARTNLRSLLAVSALRRSMPEPALRALVPLAQLEEARREVERQQASVPDVKPCLQQSAWHVPLHWFVCFDDAERKIEHDGHRARIRYETTMRSALSRTGQALEIVKGGVHPAVVGTMSELNAWLESFDPRSLVELDYASVSRLFDPEELADDHSAADIWSAVQAVGDRDGSRAALYYQRATERWAAKRLRESMS